MKIVTECKFNSLLFDFRGHGESHGAPNWDEYGIIDSADDIKTVVEYAKGHDLPGNSNIVLIPTSFSADAALIYAASDKAIKSLVMISPGTGRDSSNTNNNQQRKDWWDSVKAYTQISYREFCEVLGDITQPVHLIHGDCDDQVPIEQSYEAARLIGTNASVHAIPDGRHHYLESSQAHAKRQELLREILHT